MKKLNSFVFICSFIAFLLFAIVWVIDVATVGFAQADYSLVLIMLSLTVTVYFVQRVSK